MGKTAMQSVRDLLEQNEHEFISKDATLNLLRVYIQFEKQQILDAYWAGIEGTMNDWSESEVKGGLVSGVKVGGGAEHYYNKTYTND